tara:strand:+ start:1544 stop:1810 length:267 start_codon:yes stop_codon:yes gene_type:complete
MGKRVSSEWEILTKAVKGKHAKRFDAVLETLDDEEFMVHYPKILEYVIPKLQRVENNIKKEKDDVIQIVHVTQDLEKAMSIEQESEDE